MPHTLSLSLSLSSFPVSIFPRTMQTRILNDFFFVSIRKHNNNVSESMINDVSVFYCGMHFGLV